VHSVGRFQIKLKFHGMRMQQESFAVAPKMELLLSDLAVKGEP
jgi:hypothetical protein